MIELLARLCIKDYKNTGDARVRAGYGTLCSVTAIVLNLLLSGAKFVVGTLAGSVAISADALNNFSDAASSLLILLGFRFAGKKPDPDHPFGHGRIEYVVGLVVAALILVAGAEAGRSAVSHILHPEPLEFSWAAVLVLALSIAVKLYMSYFDRRIGRRIESSTLLMAGADARTDTVSTFLTLFCLLLYRFLHWNLDAWAGLFVSLLILKTGYDGAKETLSELLGRKADPALAGQAAEIVRSFPEIVGIHDLIIHDYGPGRLFVTLHAEVDGSGDIYALHDAIDRAEAALDARLGCQAVIHMDPVDTRDAGVAALRADAEAVLRALDPALSLHDFRVVPGPTHTNLIFDVLVPFSCKVPDAELLRAIRAGVREKHGECLCVIRLDRAYA